MRKLKVGTVIFETQSSHPGMTLVLEFRYKIVITSVTDTTAAGTRYMLNEKGDEVMNTISASVMFRRRFDKLLVRCDGLKEVFLCRYELSNFDNIGRWERSKKIAKIRSVNLQNLSNSDLDRVLAELYRNRSKCCGAKTRNLDCEDCRLKGEVCNEKICVECGASV